MVASQRGVSLEKQLSFTERLEASEFEIVQHIFWVLMSMPSLAIPVHLKVDLEGGRSQLMEERRQVPEHNFVRQILGPNPPL